MALKNISLTREQSWEKIRLDEKIAKEKEESKFGHSSTHFQRDAAGEISFVCYAD